MTKEDIIEQNPILVQLIGNHGVGAYQLIGKAMDEYAKQFGEKLIGWLNDNDFKPNSFKDNMQSDYVNNGERMHASEIVDLFIEQQNK